MLSDGALDDPYTYQHFVYCKTGFDQHMIRILLCNVLLYDSENGEIDVIPSLTSGISFAYLSKDDFLSCENCRVRILYDQIENFCNKICGFLTEVVVNQISFIQQFNNDLALVFSLLLKITAGNDFSHSLEADLSQQNIHLK